MKPIESFSPYQHALICFACEEAKNAETFFHPSNVVLIFVFLQNKKILPFNHIVGEGKTLPFVEENRLSELER